MTSKNPSNELQTDATANNLPHNAMDYLQEGCVIIGRNRRYLYVNDAAARHGRTTKESLVGRPVLEAYPGLERTQWQDLLEECMESRVTQRFEYEFEYSDGEKKWFEFRFEPVPHGVFVLSVDITQRRQDQEQLRVSRKLEALGRLTGGIAHDFNNILTVILNCTDFALKDLDESERRHKDITEIGKAAGRAASLTRQLLAFSRRQVMKPEIVDLNEVLTNMRHMLQRLIGEDITIKSQLAEDLGKSSLDPSQIEQVIMNLVINARDALPGGGWIRLETANVELDRDYANRHLSVEPGPYVMLGVADNGMGMDASIRARIFDPFFTTKGMDKGTGLGLSTVFGIVKQSRGSIWVYSEPGEGTVFKIYFPREMSVEQGETRSAPTRVQAKSNEHILLVEDDEAVRMTTQRILQEAGYCVRIATNGREAVEIYRENADKIHLVISDVVMPKMKGQELAQILHSINPDVRLLFMSGYTDESASLTGITTSGIPLIGKPFTSAELSAMVAEILT